MSIDGSPPEGAIPPPTEHTVTPPVNKAPGTPADAAAAVAVSAAELTTLPPPTEPEAHDGETEAASESEPNVDKKAIQQHELSVITSNILYKRFSAVDKEVKALKTDADKNALLASSPEKNALWIMAKLDSGFTNPIPLGIDSNPLRMTRPDGEEVTIAAFERGNGNTVYCTIINSEGSTEYNIPFDRVKTAQAHLLSEKDNITSTMSDAETRVIDQSLKSYTNDDYELPEPGTPESDAIDDLIKEAAKDAHMFTRTDLEDFIKGAGLPKEKADALREKAGNGHILPAEAFIAAMGETDLSPTKLRIRLEDAKKEIAHLKDLEAAKIKKGEPITLDEKNRLAELEEKVFVLTNIEEKYGNGEMDQIFDSIQTGDTDAEVAKGFLDAFRSGKIDEHAFQKFKDFPAFKRHEGESEAEWRARMKKNVGLIGLVALIMMLATSQAIQTISADEQRR